MAHKNERVELRNANIEVPELAQPGCRRRVCKARKGEDRGTGAEAPEDRRVGRLNWRPLSRKQIRTRLSELHISPGFVHHQPTALDRKFEPGAVFRWRSLKLIQKRPVDFLDMDARPRPGSNVQSALSRLPANPPHRAS
jgi:hypothetical protein